MSIDPPDSVIDPATVRPTLPVPGLTRPVMVSPMLSFSVRLPLPVAKASRLPIKLFWPKVALPAEPPVKVAAVMIPPGCSVSAPPAVRLTVPLPALMAPVMLSGPLSRSVRLPLPVAKEPRLAIVLL